MALDTFDYVADVGSNLSLEQRVKQAQFGNGYRMEVGDGLNPTREVWDFSFFGMLSAVKPAYKFLKNHTGKAFLWETPHGDILQVRASNIRMPSNGADTYTLTCTLTQDFTPST